MRRRLAGSGVLTWLTAPLRPAESSAVSTNATTTPILVNGPPVKVWVAAYGPQLEVAPTNAPQVPVPPEAAGPTSTPLLVAAKAAVKSLATRILGGLKGAIDTPAPPPKIALPSVKV